MNRPKFILIFLFVFINFSLIAQDDLLQMLDNEANNSPEKITGTFKATRVMLAHSVEMPATKEFTILISHHFGEITTKNNNYFGLDEATIRLGAEFGLSNNFCIGFGRSVYNKAIDGFIKIKLLNQNTLKIPVTLVYLAGSQCNTIDWQQSERDYKFFHRVSYFHQVLIARKFTKYLSLQATPTIIHRNLTSNPDDKNTVFSMGIGGRIKISNRITINGEYYYIPDNQLITNRDNPLTLGFDIDTGGHIFQLFFTNSRLITERGFITETTGNWPDGNIRFGFTISRTFGLKNKNQN